MISGFMSSEKPQPEQPKVAQREKDVYDLLAWVELNRVKVATMAVVLVAVGFGIATVRYFAEQKEVKASGALLALKVPVSAGTNTPAVSAESLMKVSQEYSGTRAAERAQILAASALFTEGKYAEAETAFKGFLNEYPESAWRATAAYGIATAQEAQNKPDAVTSYQTVATSYSRSSLADDAKLALARIHEQKNQPAEALRIYNELLAPVPGSTGEEPPHRQASELKEALLRAHPDLAATNAAPNASANPSSTMGLNLPTIDGGNTNPTLQIPITEPATNK
jgi:predicted negative regulator of RcsB-dependent stress response